MKKSYLIELLSRFEGDQEVIVEGSKEFVIKEDGPSDDRVLILIKQ